MFSENLKIARKRKDYTLEQLAKEYNHRFGGGMSKGTLSKYENGKQEPMITVVINLADLLGVSVDFLVNTVSDNTNKLIANELGLSEQSIDFIKSLDGGTEVRALNYLLENDEFKNLLYLINEYKMNFQNSETAKRAFNEFNQHLSSYQKDFYGIENAQDYEYITFNSLVRKFENIIDRLKEI
ncbi:MAG: helix-turn-helix transcriptional regulator [Clostridia bacterium]|nr:helix-turn-helix transcriptional regulator [Clostridia bacterium]